MKLLLPIAAVAAAVITASAAEAAVSRGTFTGKTDTGKGRVGITVGGGSRVTDMYFETVHLTCSDKDEYNTFAGAERKETKNRKVKIKSSGKWKLKVSTHKGASTWTASGRFAKNGSRTSGTLRVQARYDIENHLDPEGPITCDSGKLKFTATR